MRTTLARRGLAALGALLLGVTCATTASAATTPATYVALGDSYAAGDGAGSYLSDGTSCYRSLKGYPGLVASAGGYALNLQACSGAITSDVVTKQLGALTASTTYVTVTIGGNDIGFADTIKTCMSTNTTACLNALTVAEGKIATELPGKLDSVLSAVKAGAPSARIVVTNYPRLFGTKNCSLFTSFTSTEMTRMNADTDKLSDTIAAAASRAGVGFADVRGTFKGHELCTSTPWVNNVKIFSQYESFHPNASGYTAGYKPPVATALAVAPTGATAPASVKVGGTTSSDTSRGTVKVRG